MSSTKIHAEHTLNNFELLRRQGLPSWAGTPAKVRMTISRLPYMVT